jgi:hypothetical protein
VADFQPTLRSPPHHPHPESKQEAKAEARKEKEFLAKFGEKKLTKKERKALEESGLY